MTTQLTPQQQTDDALELIKNELDKANASGIKWQLVVAAIANHAPPGPDGFLTLTETGKRIITLKIGY